MLKKEEPWKEYERLYKGKWVRVPLDGTSIIGVLKEANYSYIVLNPFIANETVSQEDKFSLELRLERNIPIIISMPVKAIGPISKNFVGESLRRYPVKYNENQLELSF